MSEKPDTLIIERFYEAMIRAKYNTEAWSKLLAAAGMVIDAAIRMHYGPLETRRTFEQDFEFHLNRLNQAAEKYGVGHVPNKPNAPKDQT